MSEHDKFRCPACGKRVFNPRLERCEFCSARLPEDLRASSGKRKPEDEKTGVERALEQVLEHRDRDVDFDPFDF